MDVGFYLGELLMQQGEVSVPGLGYFVQVRISGYYDENEHKFHPPYHQVKFDVQSIDDDSLAEYIAHKKNISVASARYFAEKYITNLKQQALLGEVSIGNLGWFYTEFSQLVFRPADKIIDDTVFYGFEPISINKAGDIKPAEERPKVELDYPPRFTSPKPVVTGEQFEEAQPVELTPQPAGVHEEEEASISPASFETGEEEEKSKSPLRLLLIIFIAILIAGASVFALYRYQPDTFAKMVFWQHNTTAADTVKPKAIIPSKVVDTVKTDTIRTDTAKTTKDSVTKTTAITKKTGVITAPPIAPVNKTVLTTPQQAVATPVKQPTATTMKLAAVPGGTIAKPSDATGTRRFEVYAAKVEDMAQAKWVIKRLKKAGLDARIITDAPDSAIYISIGHYQTKQEAMDFAIRIIESGKAGGNVYAREIIPHQ